MVSTDTPEPVGLDDPVQTGTSQTDDPESPLQTSTGPSPETVYRSTFKDFGAAPELENEVWLNTDLPLHLADLRGKVVLLDMWTFG